ncbi:hypothetical protein PVAP13_7NG228434 [Panicum virgatum]|uniref:Uncharacterized protein n=1 Tax=Panicum virgatum TaxID=38727 RepID=A0A8T0Q2Z3_PANVG|nr:hypothetical protein PVAP13_7NG228434 [Panicum virgatum]
MAPCERLRPHSTAIARARVEALALERQRQSCLHPTSPPVNKARTSDLSGCRCCPPRGAIACLSPRPAAANPPASSAHHRSPPPASIRFSLLNPPVAVSNPDDHRVRHYFSRSQPIDSTSPSPFLPHPPVDSSTCSFPPDGGGKLVTALPTHAHHHLLDNFHSSPPPSGCLSPPTSC